MLRTAYNPLLALQLAVTSTVLSLSATCNCPEDIGINPYPLEASHEGHPISTYGAVVHFLHEEELKQHHKREEKVNAS